ncbi:MAG: glycosyltransferase [Pseudomonadota bacterium]
MTDLSIVIPSFRRAPILLKTLGLLFQQSTSVKQIIVVDQTPYAQDDPYLKQLQALSAEGRIVLLQPTRPSIPAAMNRGMLAADSTYVLFLDDDIEVASNFIAAHRSALHDNPVAQVGQVLQPDQKSMVRNDNYQPGSGLYRDLNFPFNSDQPADIHNCMAGNLCVERDSAIDAGGFDENFLGAAYRFETEFCRRLTRDSGRAFSFLPSAVIHHLQYQTGGTREHANHFTSVSAVHSMGDYYFALREAGGTERWRYIARRLVGSLKSRFYLKQPWYLPVRLLAEFSGLLQAIKYHLRGPRLIDASQIARRHHELGVKEAQNADQVATESNEGVNS